MRLGICVSFITFKDRVQFELTLILSLQHDPAAMLTKFFVGQVWKYNHRPSEPDSRVFIVRIDADDPEHGNIIHIYISNLSIPNPDAVGGKTIYIGHMPYDQDALERSVTELESETKELPDYEDGYRLWKAAFDDSQAGVFDVPVSEAIKFVEKSISS